MENDEQLHIVPLDWVREQDNKATRSGIIDLVHNPNDDDDQKQLGFCHIATFIPLSVFRGNERKPIGNFLGGIAGFFLAIDMLNKGDGSVVKELEGLNERCPIRFTGELGDTALLQSLTVNQLLEVLERTTPKEREVCAFLGAAKSSVTIPMASITGIFGRPQLSPISTSSQLDDVENFPLFGRLITSEVGLAVPLILYLQKNSVRHLGVVHWNDDYGNAYVRSLLQTATELYPDLKIVAADIPSNGATLEDYKIAVQTLARTQHRWFFALFGTSDYLSILPEAVQAGIAGTGDHVWILNSDSSEFAIKELVLEKESPLARATRGVGMFAPQNGRPGMEVHDKFAKRWRALDNQNDMDYITSKLPSYPDEPDVVGQALDSSIFVSDSHKNRASMFFDETIMLGLSACQAVTQDTNDGTLNLDGEKMFETLLSTSFQGASGNVTLDPNTGSRLPTTAIFRIANVVEVPVNATHATFEVQDSDVFIDGKWTQQIPYIFNDGTTRIPDDLPPYSTDMKYIGTKLRAVGLTMALLVILTSVLFAIWTVSKREEHVVRASQPIFLLILCAGTLIMSSAIIPLSIDDEIVSDAGCSIACMAVPWLASVGFVLIFAALFSKTWRVNRIFNHPGLRRIKLTAMDVMLPLVVLVGLHLIVLSAWTVISPYEWSREVATLDSFRRPIVSRGSCSSDAYVPFSAVLIVLDLGALLLASYQSYLARSITTEFAESEYIGKAIACMLLVSLVAVPTMVIVADEPRAHYFVLTSIIFVVCTTVLLFIFIPKLLTKKKTPKSTRAIWTTFNSSTVSDSSMPMGPAEGIRIVSGPHQVQETIADNKKLREENADLRKRFTESEKLVAALRASSRNLISREASTATEDETKGDESVGCLRDSQSLPDDIHGSYAGSFALPEDPNGSCVGKEGFYFH